MGEITKQLRDDCENGDIPAVKKKLQKGADPCDLVNCWSALHTTAEISSPEILQILLSSKNLRNINVEGGHYHKTPLLHACTWGNVQCAKLLKQNGADEHVKDRNGWTALHCSVWSGDLEMVQECLTWGTVKINELDGWGKTALMWACETGNVEIVRLLHSRGADVKIKDKEDMTAQQWAKMNKDVLTILKTSSVMWAQLESLSIDKANEKLRAAVENGTIDIIEILLSLGAADPSSTDDNGYSAYHLAAKCKNSQILQKLVASSPNSNLEAVSRDGFSPLLTACKYGSLDCTNFLIAKKVNVNVRVPSTGETALHLATRSKESSLVAECVQWRGINVNDVTIDGVTALMIGCQFGCLQIVKILVDVGADVNIQNSTGLSALYFGMNNERIMNLLSQDAHLINKTKHTADIQSRIKRYLPNQDDGTIVAIFKSIERTGINLESDDLPEIDILHEIMLSRILKADEERDLVKVHAPENRHIVNF